VLAMLADIQRTVYPEVTSKLHVMAQGRESSPVIDRRSYHCATPSNFTGAEFNLLLIYRPQEDEWLCWPCWLRHSGQFTDVLTTVLCQQHKEQAKEQNSS